MRLLFSLGLFLLTSFTLQAQLQEAVISYQPLIAKAAKEVANKPATPRSQKGAELPFFDDFAYNGPFPDASNWLDNQVFINSTLANQSVSIGVATFDGLDATGSPYGGGYASSDTLTSIALDLSGNAPKYISYYVQPKGLGDAPGIEDSLVLEFKNTIGEWISIQAHTVSVEEELFPIDFLPTFEFVGPIIIEDPQFLHNDFQFRFRNYALRIGAADLWHLDYIRLEETITLQENEDLAFTELPGNILLNYSSAPWRHLQDEIAANPILVLDTMEINVMNHSTNMITTAPSQFLVTGLEGGQSKEFRDQFLFDPNNPEATIPAGRHQYSNSIFGEYRSAFRNQFKDAERVEIQVDYSFDQSNNEPTTTQQNNKVSRTFNLDNFYAYDDNSAESAYFVGTGGQVAVKFTNYKADLLQAIQIQIPRIVGGDISQTNFTLKVWLNDLNSEPVFEAPFTKPLFIDEFVDSLQAFTTYVLKDKVADELSPVELPVGDFYIGWEQATPCGNVSCFPVGFDRNTPEATEHIFVNVEGDWHEIAFFFGGAAPPSQSGALMIRPVVGSEPPNDSETVSTTELHLPQIMNIFPNPSNGRINFQLFDGNYKDYQVSVFNTLGQQIKQEILSPQMTLSNQNPGIYFLQFINKTTRAIGNYKLVLK